MSDTYSPIEEVMAEKYRGYGIDPVILINSFSALLGISIFAVPWGFLMSGVLGGILIVTTVAYLSFKTTKILLLAQNKIFHSTGNIPSYAEVASEYLGPPFGSIVKIATVISCLGGCIGSLIFIGSLLSQLLHIPLDVAFLYLLIPLILLSWIRSFRDLTFFTIFGSIAIIFSITILLIDGFLQYNSDPSHIANDTMIPLILPKSVEFVGPVTFLFTIHYIILSMGKEILVRNNQLPPKYSDENLPSLNDIHTRLHNLNKFIFPLAISYAVCACMLSILGTLGYFWYRDVTYVTDHLGNVIPGCERRICENIILNLSKGPLRYESFSTLLVLIERF